MVLKTSRRSFMKKTGSLLGVSLAGPSVFSVSAAQKEYRAAVIGRTGRGNYGHGLDTIFNGLENVTVVAVADEDPAGLREAVKRSGAKRSYLDFHEMLTKEKPDIVSIGPRQPDCHREMALAAIEVGAHIYVEKPFTEYPAEADEILTAAKKKGLKVSVAHTRRYMDHFLLMKKVLDEGYLGDVLGVRIQGKQDSRVGGEDLIVLGSHDMDIMRLFFGDPQWCFASVTVNGRDITKDDIRKGREPYTVAGDTIHADYRFDNNLQCHWCSVAAPGDWNQSYRHGDRSINKWGFDIFGTKRILSHQESIGTYVLDFPFIAPGDPSIQWKPLQEVASITKPPRLSHPIRNLIYAIENDAKPQCSGEDARWAVEMVCAVYHSQRQKARVPFPLEDRGHPLNDYY